MRWIVLGALVGVALIAILLARGSAPGPARVSPGERADLDEELARYLDEGRKIEAIKLYRRLHGVGLKEAKEAVERLAADAPG